MFKLKRVSNEPVLRPLLPWEKEGVFNPGVVRVGEEVIMLYRAVGEKQSYISRLGLAKSKDGVHFERVSEEPVFGPKETFDKWATEDPRITQIDDDFYITYVAVPDEILHDGKGIERKLPLETSVALLKTRDFTSFENLGIISPKDSDNKDLVLFPRKINGRYAMLHRPNRWSTQWCRTDFTKTPDINLICATEELPSSPSIWIAWSDDLKNWSDHDLLSLPPMGFTTKIGGGMPPLETKDGWLLIYHHVEKVGQNKLIYSMRAALLHPKDPRRCISMLSYDILAPELPFETEDGRAVVFPTGGFILNDILYVYYGASDKYIGLATGSVSELLEELRKNIG